MRDRLIIGIVAFLALAILGFGVWRQQKRLPELREKFPSRAPQTTPPPDLGKGGGSPLDFAALFQNLRPAKQECFRERFGEERLDQILRNPAYTPSAEDNAVIGECLLAGATFIESPTSTMGQSSSSP